MILNKKSEKIFSFFFRFYLICLVRMPEIKTKNEKSLNIYTQMMKNVINIQGIKIAFKNFILIFI